MDEKTMELFDAYILRVYGSFKNGLEALTKQANGLFKFCDEIDNVAFHNYREHLRSLC